MTLFQNLSWQACLIGFCLIFAGWCALLAWLDARDKRTLPEPRADDRQWSINYMTDLRKWTTRL